MIACFQLPHFPAWSFVREPGWTRRLAVVEGERVVAATAAARRRGAERGLPTERALALVPGLEVRVRDRSLEQAAEEEILVELNRLTPRLEPIRPGQLFLSAPDSILHEVAQRFRAHVGAGPDRATALLAAVRSHPGHVLTVSRARRRDFLARFPVEGLVELGFSESLIEHLKLFGYPTLGAVCALSRRQLDAQFAEEGAALHELLHPALEGPVPLYLPPPTLTAEVDFDFPCREPGELLPALEPLAEELGRELRQVVARRVTVCIEARSLPPRSAGRVIVEAITNQRRVLSAARPLLMELLEEGVEVERLALELGALKTAATSQGGLFRERPSAYMAARGVHRRFPGAIKRAVVVYAHFPEDRVQFEPFGEVERRHAA